MNPGTQDTLDVSGLPSYSFSHHSLMWWGVLGLIAIEGTVFALSLAIYFYLRSHSATWPMTALPPDLLWGTLNTVILLVSLVPNHFAKKAAEQHRVAGVRLWLSIALVFGVAFLRIRVMEFATLNVRWDSNAYGTIVWVLMGLHTAHLFTDVLDSLVLDVLFFHRPFGGQALCRCEREFVLLVLRGLGLDTHLPGHLLGRSRFVRP